MQWLPVVVVRDVHFLVLLKQLLKDLNAGIDACEMDRSHVFGRHSLLSERLRCILLVELCVLQHVKVKLVVAVHIVLEERLEQTHQQHSVASPRNLMHEMVEVVMLGFEALCDAQCFVELGCQVSEEIAPLEALQVKAGHRGMDVEMSFIVQKGIVALAISSCHFNSADLCAVGFCAHLTLLDQV